MQKSIFGKPKSSKYDINTDSFYYVEDLSKNPPDEDGFTYVNIINPMFELGGLPHPLENNNEFYRLDAEKKDDYSDANKALAHCSAGGCVRFATDAEEISLRITLKNASVGMHHFCDRGVFGVDAYIGTGTDRKYVGKMMQTFADNPNFNSGTLLLPPANIDEVMINLPLYAGIEKMEIGFPKGTRIFAPTRRANLPIAFYGSSITQGGCVSRPANSYANIICRALDADCVNYGFSGSAMGEIAVAEHIASRNLSCFVMDYDYNSPSLEHLERTHKPFFEKIREEQPNLPVVFVTHPFYAERSHGDKARIDIVKQTYENAKKSGDKNVYFVDSRDFFPEEMRDLCAVDNLHPNDLGQYFMAEAIFPTVKKAIKRSMKK